MRTGSLIAIVLLGSASIAAFSYQLGVNETVARSAYVESIPIREESKCLAQNDIECMRLHWHMRASVVAESANRSLRNTFPTSVNTELEAYVAWAKAQQGIKFSGGSR
jgi:hypothetical protein